MDYITLLMVLSILCAAINVLKLGRQEPARLPPGPRGLPIIGDMLQLGTLPHQALAKLSQTYGPVMSLKLGTMTTIVFSSSDVAEEVLKKHDKNFANKAIFDAVAAFDLDKHLIAWQPADAHWRFLRKICSTEIFAVKRLEASQGLRQRKAQELLDHVLKCSQTSRAVHINQAGFTTSLNFFSNTIFSMDLAHYDSEMSKELLGLVRGLLEAIGKPNLADYFPTIKFLDPQGIRKQTEFYLEKLMAILNDIVNTRLESDAHGNNDDMLNTLIKLHRENESEFSRKDLNFLLLEMFVAGSHTTSTALEWTMAELLRHPKTLAKAQAELGEVIGKGKMVQESHIPKLSYLQAVVKESLRLHPVAPILIHKSAAEVEVSGHPIPKDAQIFVNVWSIQHDPKRWPDPYSFQPERFLDSEIDFKGQHFDLIPFGAGRRICPGLPLADRMLHLSLASLIHSFDWRLEDGMMPEDIDISEQFRLSLGMVFPLKAIPIKT